MNSVQAEKTEKRSFLEILKKRFAGKWKDWLILLIVAGVLLFVAWKVFHGEEDNPASIIVQGTETEIKISRLLEEMEGVGEAEVIVCEDENGAISAVVVCEGANDLRVIMNVREAVAAALGTDEKAVKIYLKKD